MPTEGASQFPNPNLAPRLVLYPLAGGGVALDWRLDPILIQQALAAFAEQQAVPKLYLRRVDAAGICLAEALLDELERQPAGQALFEETLEGAVQAELGLEGPSGRGWLLLARSNQLEAGPEFTPERAPVPEQARAPGSLPERAPEPVLEAATQQTGLAPRGAEKPLVAARGVQSAAAEQRDWRESPPLPTRFPDPSLAALARSPELPGSPFPLVRASAGFQSTDPAKDNTEVAVDTPRASEPKSGSPGVFSQALAAQVRADPAVVPVPDPSFGPTSRRALDPGRLDQAPPNRQDEKTPGSGDARGSGPIAPYPSAAEAQIQGELHVFGRAAPGSLLDLGGHAFRVGSGGRFSFRVALDDPNLLAALLARLPRLPVAERDP